MSERRAVWTEGQGKVVARPVIPYSWEWIRHFQLFLLIKTVYFAEWFGEINVKQPWQRS
jgi:hypothetical protein